MIIQDLLESQQQCPECGGPAFSDLILAEKKDACYHKVKASAKVWPSAYASGRLVQCRKKGAANWGNKSKNESVEQGVAETKGEMWRVMMPRAQGGHSERYYVVKGYNKDLKIWKNKSGAGDFNDRADAEAKADELNKSRMQQRFMEFAPVGARGGNTPRGPRTPGDDPWGGDDSGEDPYGKPQPRHYARSSSYFEQFEADHFDDEIFDAKTGVFKGYWDDQEGRVQIAYFKFDDPARTGGDDPGMGWYYEPQNESVAEGTLKPEADHRSDVDRNADIEVLGVDHNAKIFKITYNGKPYTVKLDYLSQEDFDRWQIPDYDVEIINRNGKNIVDMIDWDREGTSKTDRQVQMVDTIIAYLDTENAEDLQYMAWKDEDLDNTTAEQFYNYIRNYYVNDQQKFDQAIQWLLKNMVDDQARQDLANYVKNPVSSSDLRKEAAKNNRTYTMYVAFSYSREGNTEITPGMNLPAIQLNDPDDDEEELQQKIDDLFNKVKFKFDAFENKIIELGEKFNLKDPDLGAGMNAREMFWDVPIQTMWPAEYKIASSVAKNILKFKAAVDKYVQSFSSSLTKIGLPGITEYSTWQGVLGNDLTEQQVNYFGTPEGFANIANGKIDVAKMINDNLQRKSLEEKLGDNRPALGTKRDAGKSVRKWRKERGLDEQGALTAADNSPEILFYAKLPDGYKIYARVKDQQQLADLMKKYAGKEIKTFDFNDPEIQNWLEARRVNPAHFPPGMVQTVHDSVYARGSRAPSIAENNMPITVISFRKKLASMSPGDFATRFKDRSDQDLRSMARRHGLKDLESYVNKRKKGQAEMAEGQKWPDTDTSLADRTLTTDLVPGTAKTASGHPIVRGRFRGERVATRVDPSITPTSVQRKDADQKPIPAFLKKQSNLDEGGDVFAPGIQNTPEYKAGFATGKLPVPHPEGSQEYAAYYKGVIDKATPNLNKASMEEASGDPDIKPGMKTAHGTVLAVNGNTVTVQAPNGDKMTVNIHDIQTTQGVDESSKKEADYGGEYQDMVARLKQLAGQGPRKTVWDPAKRVYKTVPTAVQPGDKK